MKYAVTATEITDTGRGLVERLVSVNNELSMDDAATLAESLSKRADITHVYVRWCRPSDGQTGYLNEIEGHSLTGQNWHQ